LVRARKRQRQATDVVQQQQQQTNNASRAILRPTGPAPGRRARGLLVVGKAANSSQDGMLAAEQGRGNIPVERAVFYVDNVGMQHSATELRTFVSKMGVRVLSCFEVKPRRRRFELNPPSRKAFRLCVADSDRGVLLDANKWPNHITVSEWYFKSALPATENTRRTSTVTSVSSVSQPRSRASSDGPSDAVAIGEQTTLTITADVHAEQRGAAGDVNVNVTAMEVTDGVSNDDTDDTVIDVIEQSSILATCVDNGGNC